MAIGRSERIYNLAKAVGIESSTLVALATRLRMIPKPNPLAMLSRSDQSTLFWALGQSFLSHSRELEDRGVLSLSAALALDGLHVQVAELFAILEFQLRTILPSSNRSSQWNDGCLVDLINQAYTARMIDCVNQERMQSIRLIRNQIAHRNPATMPDAEQLGICRYVLSAVIVQLLSRCDERGRAEILCGASAQSLPMQVQIA